MQLGFVGLGRMGSNMVTRLLQGGHSIVTWDVNADAVRAVAGAGARGAASLAELAGALAPPRAVWVMVPAGEPTERTVRELAAKQIQYIDAGTGGGVWGLKEGSCLMVGGDADACRRLEPIFRSLAPPDGYLRVGGNGSGHYVKMIHNGIEYGLLQAYAEGFALLHAAGEFDLDLHRIAELWRHGSVVRSWLLDLTELALANEEEFSHIRGYVEDSGEGRWTVEEAINRAVPAPAITVSLYERFWSRQPDSFAAKIVAALRNQFGGHKFFEESAGAEVSRQRQQSGG